MKGFYRGGEPGGAWAGIYDTVIDFYSSKRIRRKEKSAAEEQSEKGLHKTLKMAGVRRIGMEWKSKKEDQTSCS